MRVTVRRTDERGQGGLEILPFGFLVLVAGTLLVVNVWAVIDAKLATESASREAARAFVESVDPTSAHDAGVAAAREAIVGHHRDADAARYDGPGAGSFVRCARVTWSVEYDVPSLTLPFIGGFGPRLITARSSHSEIVDPYRSGLPVDAERGVTCAA
jgi:hypothetical protein